MDLDQFSFDLNSIYQHFQPWLFALSFGLTACGTSIPITTDPDNASSTSNGNNIPLAAAEPDSSDNTTAFPAVNEAGNNGLDPTAQSTSPDSEVETNSGEETVTPEPALCSSDADVISTETIRLVNVIRAESRNCGNDFYEAATPIAWNEDLYQAATTHASDMASVNFFSHTGSDGSDIGSRVSQTGYTWWTVGENIAAGQSTLEQAINGWVQSPGHCKNLMNPDFAEVAIACVSDAHSDYEFYWTNVLASQR